MSAKEVMQLRERLSISQEELADALGLHGRGAISRWETGLRDPSETVRRLVFYLNELPKKEALELLKRLGKYGTRKGRN